MNIKKVALVIVDISGYTQFIRAQKLSAIHAEEIVFELLEAVINHAAYPLTLNKLEGDAAFLYAEVNAENQMEVARDVARQSAEQVHPYSGAPLSVSPLTWSHATLVLTIRELLAKQNSLKRSESKTGFILVRK